ncbi:MAG: hypothetical protein Q8934_12810 [Bacillota bacterium]|nr:hypothetical protein [Bacillota bacterium]
MIKRMTLTIVIFALFNFVLFGCSDFENKEKNTNEITNIMLHDVTKIVFFDGRGGINQPFTLTDKQKIDEFMKMIGNIKVQKEIKHEDAAGWIHIVDFYNKNKKLMSITFTNPLKIDGKYYDIVKGQINTETIDGFIKSVNPKWKLP